MTYYSTIKTPIGELLLRSNGEALTRVYFVNQQQELSLAEMKKDHALFVEVKKQLNAYFAGELTQFDLPLAQPGTDFQQSVWQALQTIPYGTTQSYQDIATAIGRGKAVRAVGAANGRNQIPIIIPCHRVIGKNGTLTGFAGGLSVKEQLLALELKFKN